VRTLQLKARALKQAPITYVSNYRQNMAKKKQKDLAAKFASTTEIAQAKARIQRCGPSVFNAEIVDYPSRIPRGDSSLIMVGNRRFTAEQVLRAARAENPITALELERAI